MKLSQEVKIQTAHLPPLDPKTWKNVSFKALKSGLQVITPKNEETNKPWVCPMAETVRDRARLASNIIFKNCLVNLMVADRFVSSIKSTFHRIEKLTADKSPTKHPAKKSGPSKMGLEYIYRDI